MPNLKSAIKRVRTAERNRLYNRYWKSRCKTALKKVLAAVEAADAAAAVTAQNDAQSVFDKAVVKGVLHRNTAARKKAFMAAKVKTLQAPAAE